MRELNINGEKWVPLEEAQRHFESRIVVSKEPATLVYRDLYGRNFEFSVTPIGLDFHHAEYELRNMNVCNLRDTGYLPAFSGPIFDKVTAKFRINDDTPV